MVIGGESQDLQAGLRRRTELFLEDGDWSAANDCAQRLLDYDPENTEHYFLLLLSQLKVKHSSELNQQTFDLDKFPVFTKAMRFADQSWKDRLNGYKNTCNYNRAVTILDKTSETLDCRVAFAILTQLPQTPAVLQQMQRCELKLKELETLHKRAQIEQQYQQAKQEKNVTQLKRIKQLYLDNNDIVGANHCDVAIQKINEQFQTAIREDALNREREAAQKRKRLLIGILSIIGAVVLVLVIISVKNANKEQEARELYNETKSNIVGTTLSYMEEKGSLRYIHFYFESANRVEMSTWVSTSWYDGADFVNSYGTISEVDRGHYDYEVFLKDNKVYIRVNGEEYRIKFNSSGKPIALTK